MGRSVDFDAFVDTLATRSIAAFSRQTACALILDFLHQERNPLAERVVGVGRIDDEQKLPAFRCGGCLTW